MIPSKKFLKLGVVSSVFLLLILTLLSLLCTTHKIFFKSILIGDSLAFLNFVLGLLFTFWGIENTNKRFLTSLYGGMLLRLILLLFLMILALLFLDINEITFIFSLLFFYFFYLIIEIIYLNFRKK